MSRNRFACAGLLLACWVPARLLAQEPAPDAQSLDSLLSTPINVSAKYQQIARQATGSVTILTHEQIERYGYRTLPDLLAGVSGFYLSYDRNYSYLGTRGFSRSADFNSRILLLVDGHEISEAIWGSAPIELPVNLQSLERVEIVRGPGSTVHGGGAVFGVINLVTRQAAQFDRSQAELRGASYGGRGVSGVLTNGARGGLDAVLSGTWDASDGQDLFYPEYDTPVTHQGVAHNLDWERRWQVHGRARRGGLTLNTMLTSRTKAIPTGAYGMAFDLAPAHTFDSYGFAELALERALDASKQIRVRGFFDRYRYDGMYAYGLYEDRERARDEAVGGEASLLWDIGSAHHVTAGAEYRRDVRIRYDEVGKGAPTGFDRSVDIASVYLEDEYQPSSRITVLGALRADDYSTFGAALSPRAALLYEPVWGTTLKLLYGHAFRAPDLYEARGGGFGYQPNSSLRAEHANTVELVVQQRLSPTLLGTATAFHYEIRGLIDLTADSIGGTYVYRNLGEASALGAELGLEARLHRGRLAYASYTYQRAHNDLTGADLTNAPPHMVKAGVSAPLTSWLGGAVEARAESGRGTLAGTRTRGYVLGNLHVWLQPPGHGLTDSRLQLSFRVNNILNTAYATPGGVEHLQAAIAQDRRNVSAELRYQF
jgi:iron complex outermembrane receptor protein